jgi:hypothetical protein
MNKTVETNPVVITGGVLKRGITYGRKAWQIYEKCCETFGWDSALINKIRWTCWARYVDKEKRYVWFVNHSNLTDTRVEWWKSTISTERLKYDTSAQEYDDAQPDPSESGERIVFAKLYKKDGYQFLGVYRIDGDWDANPQIYKLIDDEYSC